MLYRNVDDRTADSKIRTVVVGFRPEAAIQKLSSESSTSHVYDMHEFHFVDAFKNITIKHGGLCVLCNL